MRSNNFWSCIKEFEEEFVKIETMMDGLVREQISRNDLTTLVSLLGKLEYSLNSVEAEFALLDSEGVQIEEERAASKEVRDRYNEVRKRLNRLEGTLNRDIQRKQ